MMPNKILTIEKTAMALPAGQYFNAKHPKEMIVLHFTAGSSVSGAIASWKADLVAVGTAYLVSQAGIVYQAFDPECWAYHLGIQTGDPTHRQDKRSIGIEMVNVGPLRLNKAGDGLCFWPSNWTTPFCKLDQPDLYVKADFRGEKYFAAFPKPQIDATAELVRKLCVDFGIPTSIFQAGDLSQFHGISTHTDFRKDKFDIGPAFPLDAFRDLLNAPLP